jgi:hypothetical protein
LNHPARRISLLSAARLQRHAQDAVDAEPGVLEAGVGVVLFVYFVSGPRTLSFLRAPHVGKSVSPGWLTFRTRACAFFPPAVVNGLPTTSHSPVSSSKRSPTCSSIGRTRRVGRSGRRDGSLPGRITSRAFARRTVSSGMAALQSPVGWSCQIPGGPNACSRHPGEPDGRRSSVYALKDQSVRGNG